MRRTSLSAQIAPASCPTKKNAVMSITTTRRFTWWLSRAVYAEGRWVPEGRSPSKAPEPWRSRVTTGDAEWGDFRLRSGWPWEVLDEDVVVRTRRLLRHDAPRLVVAFDGEIVELGE